MQSVITFHLFAADWRLVHSVVIQRKRSTLSDVAQRASRRQFLPDLPHLLKVSVSSKQIRRFWILTPLCISSRSNLGECEAPRSFAATVEDGDGTLDPQSDSQFTHCNCNNGFSHSNKLVSFPENGIIVYTDNERVIVYYQCTRVLQDGTCDPTHAHLDITVNKRSVEVFKLKWFNVLLRKLCFDPNNMQLVPHDGMSSHVTFRVTSLSREFNCFSLV